MSLKARLIEDMKAAMKGGEKDKLLRLDEILHERDELRGAFWRAFDRFSARHAPGDDASALR